MPYYLTDLVNTGPPTRFKPRGFDLSSHWSILALDRVKVVMWSVDPISLPGVDLVADDKDETTGAGGRAALATLRGDGRTIPTRFGNAIGELLMFPPSARWPALRSMTDGVFRVKMGSQLLWTAVDPAGPRKRSKRAVDSFNRANGNLNASTSSDGQFTWTETVGTAWAINTNRARRDGSADLGQGDVAQSSFVLDTDDMDVQFDFVTGTKGAATSINAGAVARGNGIFADPLGGYLGLIQDDGGGTFSDAIWDVETSTQLAGGSSSDPVGTALKFTVNGSLLEVFRNGVSQVSVTDTNTVGVNKGGIYSYAENAGDIIEIDNFLIQDVGFVEFPFKTRSRGFNLQQMADAEDEGRFNELDIRNWW